MEPRMDTPCRRFGEFVEMDLKPYAFIDRLKALPFVDAVYLYGSRARGDNMERSDIDLAIDCPRAEGGEWHKVLDIIDHADTLLMIDCLRYDELKADDRLKHNIDRDKVRL